MIVLFAFSLIPVWVAAGTLYLFMLSMVRERWVLAVVMLALSTAIQAGLVVMNGYRVWPVFAVVIVTVWLVFFERNRSHLILPTKKLRTSTKK